MPKHHKPSIYEFASPTEEIIKNTRFSVRSKRFRAKTALAIAEAPLKIEIFGEEDNKQHLKQKMPSLNTDKLPTSEISPLDLVHHQSILTSAGSINEFLTQGTLSISADLALLKFLKLTPWAKHASSISKEAKNRINHKPKLK